VKVSFFGSLKLNRVHEPEVAADNRLQAASLLDVAATMFTTIQQRAQARDYEDLSAIVGSGISLADAPAGSWRSLRTTAPQKRPAVERFQSATLPHSQNLRLRDQG
jgi:hypothetical protein